MAFSAGSKSSAPVHRAADAPLVSSTTVAGRPLRIATIADEIAVKARITELVDNHGDAAPFACEIT